MRADDALPPEMAARLPGDVAWSRTTWRAIDPSALRHPYSEDWDELSCGTGRLTETAAAVRNGMDGAIPDRIRSIAETLDPERLGLIFLGANDPEGPFVVLDGNHRATALLVGGIDHDAPIRLAISKTPIWNWEK
ncbi:MAG: hypothetical protein ACYTHK_14050 [Planctomycetota bacterium]|jgi:hypothetical protein